MENLLDRFLRYVAVDTQSDENSESQPSTGKQLVLLEMLRDELRALGLEAELDQWGYVMATLPSNLDHKAPAIGFIAHVDTSPDASGKDVKAQIIRDYDGGDIELKGVPGLALRVADFPELAGYKGQTIITTDAARSGRQGGSRRNNECRRVSGGTSGSEAPGSQDRLYPGRGDRPRSGQVRRGPLRCRLRLHDGRWGDRRAGVRELQCGRCHGENPGEEHSPGICQGQDEKRHAHRNGVQFAAAGGTEAGIYRRLRGLLPPDRLQGQRGAGRALIYTPRPRPRTLREEKGDDAALRRVHQRQVGRRHRQRRAAPSVLQHAQGSGASLPHHREGGEGYGNERDKT